MKNILPFLPLIIFLSFTQNVCAQFNYISPVPESKMHSKETGIILRTGSFVNAASLHADLFSISGSVSGEHIVSVKLAADKKSILVQPFSLFSAGESVTVTVSDGILNSDGSLVEGISFRFEVRPEISAEKTSTVNNAGLETGSEENDDAIRTICDNLPTFIITSTGGAFYDQPVFYWNHVAVPAISDCWTATIISSEGDSIYSQFDTDRGFDFKLNDNGYITYYNKVDTCFDMLDSSYSVVKKIYMGNGYDANKHEMRIYPDGYRLMQCYDEQEVDMTPYGGVPNANVTGLVIQQIDPDDNVLFEWRSWDHFQITDAANDISLTTNDVDYVHGNSMELDFDGNLLISSRHLDEITKIDISTGNIIWRMGGENNEFTFIDNPDGPKPFSHQHHFRLLSNGHYTLLDNGNYQTVERSIAKEFVLDQVNKTATLVWSYVHPPINGYEVYASGLGSMQLLPNGNRLIDWGQISPNVAFADIPNFTEVTADGNIVWEFKFADSTYVAYRAHKFSWDRCNLINGDSLKAGNINATSVDLHWNDHTKVSTFALEYKVCSSPLWISIPLTTNFYHLDGLLANTCYDWRVQSFCTMYDDSFYTQSQQFTTSYPLSAFEPGNEQTQFTLYPNPASNETVVDFFSGVNAPAEITVYDLRGAVILHQVLSAQKGTNLLKIEVEFLSSAMYAVALKLSGGIQYRHLVIQ
ncbi:MAG: arylsulfotransferase family protein [Chitinophagales bacterium]